MSEAGGASEQVEPLKGPMGRQPTPGIDSLRRVLPAPSNPTYTGSASGWRAIESSLRVSLPTDYKKFIAVYGAGSVDGYLVIFCPFSPSSSLDHNLDRLREGYASLIAALGYSPVPYPVFPEPGGLLPWGSTANGDVCTWITDDGDPDDWPVLVDDGGGDWERLDMSMTAVIYAGLTERLQSQLLCFPSPEPQFFPELPS